MRSASVSRAILGGFIAAFIMAIIMYAAPVMGMPEKEVSNSPFTAHIEEIWVPDGTLNSIYCRVKDRTMIRENIDLVMVLRVENKNLQPIEIANYSLDARTPLKGWKQIKRIKPVLPEKFFTEYIDSSNPTPKYLDFSKDSFDVLAQTKALEAGHSITGWSFFNFGYKPDLKSTKFRLKLYNARGKVIQEIELREGEAISWISLKAIENPFPLCKLSTATLDTPIQQKTAPISNPLTHQSLP
jgi:hypothetical protein